jgi:hypothetical protein
MIEPRVSIPPEVLRELEDSVGRQPMFGMALGSLLNDVVILDLINGQGQWNAAKRFRWLMGRFLISRRKAFRPAPPSAAASGAILVTWRSSSPRIDDLLKPVIEELGAERCTVLYEKHSVVAQVPRGAALLQVFSVLPHEPEVWMPEFRRCWPAWKAALKDICRRYALSAAIYERLAIELVHGSQFFVGFRQLLGSLRPAAILTEYDRSARWSCLVLAARSLGIPTFTLQHGVLSDGAMGYAPVIADKIFCWGETAKEELVRCGVSPEQVEIGGCPRLARDSKAGRGEGRRKLGLDPNWPMVMLGTAPYAESDRRQLVEIFCQGMETLDGVSAVVRLHPSEKLPSYARAIERFPQVVFCENDRIALDDALAAADIVAVHSSGLGSDALVKGRLVAVIDVPGGTLGHGAALVEQAACPRVTSAGELAKVIRRILHDEAYRRQLSTAAEEFVLQFCAYFGEDSARHIAACVQGQIALPAAVSPSPRLYANGRND